MICLTMAAALAGCAGYQVGNRTLYRPDVQTVHVPVFESDSYRRGLAEWLTEAVVKEIALKTPYRVVPADEADSVLLGRIVQENKKVIFENFNDIPRALETTWLVEIRWQGPRGDLLGNAMTYPLPIGPLLVSEQAMLIPESGQSVVTSQQQVVQQLARQIVSQMEAPW